jgi:superoxide dismutase, Fe-Mn family
MNSLSRRQWIQTTSAAFAAWTLESGRLTAASANAAMFELPKLPYAFDALEPHIDAKTMEIHHDRHHKTYVDNLNKALAGTEWINKPIETLLTDLKALPEKLRPVVRNNGGGHWNHTMFWQMMSAKTGKPSAELQTAIDATFKSTEELFKALKDGGLTQFGSGWSWLVLDKTGKLAIVKTPNQDNPLMDGKGIPLLGVDVWEHAYYLKYQNKRADYLDAFMKVINWEFVSERFANAKKGA